MSDEDYDPDEYDAPDENFDEDWEEEDEYDV